MKCISWPLGKIEPQGKTVARLLRLQTEKDELLRPILRLYPLEVSAAESVVLKRN